MRHQLERQFAHWTAATHGLLDLSRIASPAAWAALGNELGILLRKDLLAAVERLRQDLAQLGHRLGAATTDAELQAVQRGLIEFRRSYLRVEATLDFFGDAINTRTSESTGGLLRACDVLARRSMEQLLEPLGRPTPRVLTYLDCGLGASILKADLPLWDPRTRSPVAVVKVTRHNLLRPTALIHETGHQIAHLLHWTPELKRLLEHTLASDVDGARRWSNWASEIVADLYAFAHTGFASVATLHDVIASESRIVTGLNELDPHPSGWLRVLLGCALCRVAYGEGPWDALETAWRRTYPISGLPTEHRAVLERGSHHVPRIARALLDAPYAALGGRRITEVVDPVRVSPAALAQLEAKGGAALYVSSQWVQQECLRLLALSGFKIATDPASYGAATERQRAWMEHLGRMTQSA
jgi:hypothetical protein